MGKQCECGDRVYLSVNHVGPLCKTCFLYHLEEQGLRELARIIEGTP